MSRPRRALPVVALLAAGLALPACEADPFEPAPRVIPPPAATSRLDPVSSGPALSQDDLRTHLERLAADALMGRETGSLGGLRAARYIAEVFARAGLEPAFPVDPAGDPLTAGWLQDIGYRGFPVAGLPEFEVLKADADPSAPRPDPGARPRERLVYGRDFEYVEGGQTDGLFELVVVADAEAAAAAAPRRDAALLLLAGRRERGRWLEAMGAPDGDGWGALLLPWRPGVGTPRPDAGHGIARHAQPPAPLVLRLYGDTVERLTAEEGLAVRLRLAEGVQLPAYNVVGRLPGVGTPERPELADEVVVFSAHYDHIGTRAPPGPDDPHPDDLVFNGADDDASGVAYVLELAEAFAAGPPPARTLVFLAATGEEHGLLGTHHYLDHPVAPLDDTVFNLNFEMVGRPDPATGAGVLWLTGFERTPLGPTLAGRGLAVAADPHPEQMFFVRSDNFAFVRRGVPGQSLSSFGLHDDYHRISDEIETLDFEHMHAGLATAWEAARLLAGGDFEPGWAPGGDPFGDATGTR